VLGLLKAAAALSGWLPLLVPRSTTMVVPLEALRREGDEAETEASLKKLLEACRLCSRLQFALVRGELGGCRERDLGTHRMQRTHRSARVACHGHRSSHHPTQAQHLHDIYML
jgi:hypothetical protein